MNIVTKAEIRKPLTFAAWHRRRYGRKADATCNGWSHCIHFYACYLSSLESLRRGKFKKIKRARK